MLDLIGSFLSSILGGWLGAALTRRSADRAARRRQERLISGHPIVISCALRRVYGTAIVWAPGSLIVEPDRASWRGLAGAPLLDLPRATTAVTAADHLDTDEIVLAGGRGKIVRLTTAHASYDVAFDLRDLVAVRTAFPVMT